MVDMHLPWTYWNHYINKSSGASSPIAFGRIYSVNDPNKRQDPYIIYQTIPIYLGRQPGTERMVLYTTQSRLKAMAQIQRYDEAARQWVVEYQKEAEGIPFFQVLTGYWELIQRNVVVLYYTAGSGSFLTYTVVGMEKQKITEFVDGKEIFQGSIQFDGGKLIEGYGVRAKVWVMKNKQYTLVPYKIPVIPGALAIEFSITPEGRVKIPKTLYKVPVDTIVQLTRTDLNQITERLLYSYTPIFKMIPHRNAFKMTGKGSTQFTIIPEGYNWDKSVNVTVEGV